MNPSPVLVIRLLLEVEQLRQEVQTVFQQAAALTTQTHQFAEQTKLIHAQVSQLVVQMARTRALLKKQRQQAG